MEPDDDQELIARARQGDTAAFEALVHRHDRAVLRLARSLTRSDSDAQDIYQETFLKMFRSLGQFRQESSVGTWVHRIAVNACLDHFRRTGLRPGGSLEARPGSGGAGLEGEGRAPFGGGTDVPGIASEGDPERALASREIRARIASALGHLPARERVVFRLRHDEGMRGAAIAAILGTTEETVRNCLYRAHQRLREALGDLVGNGAPASRARSGHEEGPSGVRNAGQSGQDSHARGWSRPHDEVKESLR